MQTYLLKTWCSVKKGFSGFSCTPRQLQFAQLVFECQLSFVNATGKIDRSPD